MEKQIKPKFKRAPNFGEQERTLILEYVMNNATIIENKSTDIFKQIAKKERWNELTNILMAHGFNRDPKTIRDYYQCLKADAKRVISKYNLEMNQTGGGSRTCRDPTDLDWQIYNICPEDFAIDHSKYDSDKKRKRTAESPFGIDTSSSTAFDFEPVEKIARTELPNVIRKYDIQETLHEDPLIPEVIVPGLTSEESSLSTSSFDKPTTIPAQASTSDSSSLIRHKVVPESTTSVPAPATKSTSSSLPANPSDDASTNKCKKKQMSLYEWEMYNLYKEDHKKKNERLEKEAKEKKKMLDEVHAEEMKILAAKLEGEKIKNEIERLKLFKLKKELNID